MRLLALSLSLILSLFTASPLRADDTEQEAEAKKLSSRISLCLKYLYAQDTIKMASLAPYMPTTVNRLYTLLYEETTSGDGLIGEATRMLTNVRLQAWLATMSDSRVDYQAMEQAIVLFSDNSGLHSLCLLICAQNYGSHAIEIGDFESAAGSFSRALSIDQTVYPDPTLSPCRILLLQGYSLASMQLARWSEVGEAMLQVADLSEEGSEEYIEALSLAASAFEEAGDSEKAAAVQEQLWKALEEDEESSLERVAEMLVERAYALIQSEQEAEVLSLMQEAVALFEQDGMPSLEYVRPWLAFAYINGAHPYIERIEQLLESQLPSDNLTLLATLTFAHLKAGNNQAAYEMLQQVNALVTQVSDEELAEAEDALLAVYTQQSDYDNQLRLLRRALVVVEKLAGTNSNLAYHYRMTIAEVEAEAGNYAVALQELDAIAEDFPQAAREDKLLAQRATIYSMQGEYEKAISIAEGLVEGSEAFDMLSLLVACYVCECDLRLSDPAEYNAAELDSLRQRLRLWGERMFAYSLDTYEETNSNTLYARLYMLGVLLICRDNDALASRTAECESLILQLDISEVLRKQYLEALAYYYIRTGQAQHAQELINVESLDYAYTPAIYKQNTLALSAEAAQRQGNTEQAQEWYGRFADFAIEQVGARIGLLPAAARALYWREHRQMLLWGGRYCDDSGQPTPFAGRIYDLCLYAKQLLLGTEMAFRRSVLATGDADLEAKMNELFNLRTALAQGQADDYEGVNARADELEAELLKACPAEAVGTMATWQDIQQALPEDGLAIEITEYQDIDDTFRYGAAIVRKDWSTPAFVKIGTKADIDGVLRMLELDETSGQAAWGYLLPYLDGITTIYFSPAGIFHRSPVEAMALPGIDCFGVRYDVHRLSSTAQLLAHTQEEGANAVVYGGLDYGTGHRLDSLPGTRIEAADVATALREQGGMQVDVLTDKDGTEDSFLALSGARKQIVHVGTHGFYESRGIGSGIASTGQISMEDEALTRSGIYLSNGNRLTAQEVAGLDLRGLSLVTLSACDTGLGRVTGDGVFGLQRGFKKAGAETLLMSLWKVSDEVATQLMISFYRHWLGGQSQHEALRTAQQEVRAGNHSRRDDWAAFVLLDDKQ